MNEMARIRMETMFQNADRLLNQKQYEDAFDILKTINETDPSFGKAYNHLAWLYHWRLKDFVKAEENYKKAIELSPEYTPTYTNYAILLNTLRRWDDVAKTVSSAMSVPGVNRGALHNELGIMNESQGKFKEAIEEYRQYAFNSVETDTVDAAKSCIERCKKKTEMFR
jgi:Tfp pilus assembly protein PilF